MKKRFSLVALMMLVAMVLVCVSGCQGASTASTDVKTEKGDTKYPVTITDDEGTDVTLDAEPQKIVSLSPANTEILFSLDAGSRQVGRTDYCNYPEEAKSIESIGDYSAPNVEKIISLDPDLVLATDFIDANVRKQIEATGAKVVVYKATSIEGVMVDIVNTGILINANDQASNLISTMVDEEAKLTEACAKVETPKSVFIDLGDYYSAGDDSMLDSMLSAINASNIAAGTGNAWPQLSVEQVIADNPDVYISFLNPVDQIKKVPGFDQVNAIKNNQVYAYDMTSSEADMMQRPGPRIVEGLSQLAKIIYPDAVK